MQRQLVVVVVAVVVVALVVVFRAESGRIVVFWASWFLGAHALTDVWQLQWSRAGAHARASACARKLDS